MSLRVERLTPGTMDRLVADASPGAVLPEGAAARLVGRLDELARGAGTLDAWAIEHAGHVGADFAWTARRARRRVGHGALARVRGGRVASAVDGVADELDDLRARGATGQVHPRSLAAWVHGLDEVGTALVTAAAVAWCAEVDDLAGGVGASWRVATDAVVRSRPGGLVLRARRDLVIPHEGRSVVVRVRSGHPGPSAGPGLRAELAVAALARADGRAPARLIGAWPEAGLALSVDGDEAAVRAGARDLLRAARRLGGARLAA